MSVLIKGMKMPECCDVCQFSDWSNLHQTAMCKVCDYEPCFEDYSQEYTSKRSNNCPLVELPEKHGRLIDESIILEMIRKSMGIKNLSFLYNAEKSVVNEIYHAPTVIEAEGE